MTQTVELGRAAEARRSAKLVCRAVHDEAPGVKTYAFDSLDDGLNFHAGQFMNLKVEKDGLLVSRSFTVASAPGSSLSFTIKVQPSGAVTKWLHDNLAVGMMIDAEGPFGEFYVTGSLTRPLTLVSAGSGATPMASIVRWLEGEGIDIPVHYIHCGRTSGDLLFMKEMEEIAAKRRNFLLDWVITGQSGRPDEAYFSTKLLDAASSDLYCCGPQAFMETVRAAFLGVGGEPAHYHEESFGAGPAASPTMAVGTGLSVRLEPRGVEFEVLGDETILDAALRSGLSMPYSCRQGMCSTCRVRLTSGEVDMNQNGGLFDDEVEDGDILVCCSRPLTPIVISTES